MLAGHRNVSSAQCAKAFFVEELVKMLVLADSEQ